MAENDGDVREIMLAWHKKWKEALSYPYFLSFKSESEKNTFFEQIWAKSIEMNITEKNLSFTMKKELVAWLCEFRIFIHFTSIYHHFCNMTPAS